MYVNLQLHYKEYVFCVQRGYLSSRNTLLSSLFAEANNNNFAATMIWEWIAWNIDDRSYDFSVGQDGSSAQQAQVNYMNSKVGYTAVSGQKKCTAACGVAWCFLISMQKAFSGARLEQSSLAAAENALLSGVPSTTRFASASFCSLLLSAYSSQTNLLGHEGLLCILLIKLHLACMGWGLTLVRHAYSLAWMVTLHAKTNL